MRAAILEIFDKTVQDSDRWLRIVMAELETDNPRLAFSALRATLHALRDRVGHAKTAQLAVHLPILLRGVYYDGWQPAEAGTHDVESFLEQIASSLRRSGDLLPLAAAKATFTALSTCADAQKIEELLHVPLPEIRLFWPRPVRANRPL